MCLFSPQNFFQKWQILFIQTLAISQLLTLFQWSGHKKSLTLFTSRLRKTTHTWSTIISVINICNNWEKQSSEQRCELCAFKTRPVLLCRRRDARYYRDTTEKRHSRSLWMCVFTCSEHAWQRASEQTSDGGGGDCF